MGLGMIGADMAGATSHEKLQWVSAGNARSLLFLRHMKLWVMPRRCPRLHASSKWQLDWRQRKNPRLRCTERVAEAGLSEARPGSKRRRVRSKFCQPSETWRKGCPVVDKWPNSVSPGRAVKLLSAFARILSPQETMSTTGVERHTAARVFRHIREDLGRFLHSIAPTRLGGHDRAGNALWVAADAFYVSAPKLSPGLAQRGGGQRLPSIASSQQSSTGVRPAKQRGGVWRDSFPASAAR